MIRKVNQNGIDLIKQFESFKSEAYRCPAGVWTIGYGHTGNDVVSDKKISEDEAIKLLEKDLEQSANGVEQLVHVDLTDNQFAALVSFAFNAGTYNLACSTLLKRLNAGDYQCVPSELAKWVKATDPKTKQKITLKGLVRRRTAECLLWLEDNGDSSHLVLSDEMVQSVESDDDSPRFQVIARGGLKMREGAGMNYDVRQVLEENSFVYIIKEKDSWAAVDIQGDGLVDGWVSIDYLKQAK